MAVFWVSFRLADEKVGGRSYDDRLDALNKAVDKHCTDWWGETTSFYVFESASTILSIASDLKKAVAPTHDLVLTRNMDAQSSYIIGANAKQNIHTFMPYLKKL